MILREPLKLLSCIRNFLYKLESFGIKEKLLTWIMSFLSDRYQCTVVENSFSNVTWVKSGVIQGSVLGPLLFIMFVNDVVNVINECAKCNLYADDVKLYSSVTCSEDSTHLQHALNAIISWSEEWQLKINMSKCNILHVGSTNKKYCYYFKDIAITSLNCVKDLGIDMDSNLKFDHHISRVVSKARSRVSCMFRGFVSRNPILFKNAFVTYVRPILEYCSNVWCPMYVKYVDTIERVQRQFTKYIRGLSYVPYQERLCVLGLESLEIRRLKHDLIYYFKIFNGQTPFNSEDYFQVNQCDVDLRFRQIILVPEFHTDLGKNNFFSRRIDIWNHLPESTRLASSVKTFIKLIDNFDMSKYLIGSMWRT